MSLFNVVYRGKDTVELKYGSVYRVERRYVRRGENGGTSYKLKGVEGKYSDNLFQEPKENRPSHIAVLRDSNMPTKGATMEHLKRCKEDGTMEPVLEEEVVTSLNIIYGNLYVVYTKEHVYFVQHASEGKECQCPINPSQEPKENRPSHIAVLRDSNPPTYGKTMEHLMRCEEDGAWEPVFEKELVTGVKIIYGNLYAVHTKKHTYFVQHCPYKMQTSEETIDEELNA